MISKEVLQRFVDNHADEIYEILPGGLKNKKGKWLLVCPILERFDLDYSKVKAAQPAKEEVVEEVTEVVEEAPKKTKKSKKKK